MRQQHREKYSKENLPPKGREAAGDGGKSILGYYSTLVRCLTGDVGRECDEAGLWQDVLGMLTNPLP